MTGTPTQLTDKTGRVVFEGTQDGGGGSQPVQALYFGNLVTIADGNSAPLTFDLLGGGTALLDVTAPANPLILADGLYAVSLVVSSGSALTAGGRALVTINGPLANQSDSTQTPELGCGVSLVQQYAAGDVLAVLVTNNDGVASRDYLITSCLIVKIA